MWESPWFGIFVILILLVLAYLGYQWRIRSEKAHSRELAGQVAERTREMSALYTITAVVSSSLDLDETLTEALDKTLEVMDCATGGIHLLKNSGNELELTYQQGLSPDCVIEINQLFQDTPFLDHIIAAGDPYILENVSTDLHLIEPSACLQNYKWLAITPLIAHGKVLGTLFMLARRPRTTSGRDIELLGSIGNQIGVAVENARLFEAEHLRADQFQLINQVSRHFSSTLDIDEVLAQVVGLIQQSFGYYHVAIGLVEGDEVVYRMGAGPLWDDPEFDFWPARLKIGTEGLSGWVAAMGRPLLVSDVSKEPRYIWMRNSQAQSELTVPVFAKEEVIGVLDLQSNQLDDFDETDLVVMQSLAGQAGIAIENAQLYKQAQQLAVVEERNRLARDLHDSVTQSIYSLTLLAEAGKRMINNGNTAQIIQNQARLGAIAQQALQEMRLLVYELRPLDLKQAGLLSALEQRLEVVERRAGVEARLIAPENLQLSPEIEEVLYRITNEALNNALKHASPTAVSVYLQTADQQITLTVTDNGCGFEPEIGKRQGGLGLVSMCERAEGVNGRLWINSTPDQGTTIQVEIPLDAGESQRTEDKNNPSFVHRHRSKKENP